MFYRIFIIFIILNYVKSKPTTHCLQGEIECDDGQCCPLVPDMFCDASKCGKFMECNELNRCQCKQGFFEYYDLDEQVSGCALLPTIKCATNSECGLNAQCSAEAVCECVEGFMAQNIPEDGGLLSCGLSESFSKSVSLDCPSDYTKCSLMCCAPKSQCVEGQCVCAPELWPIIEENTQIVHCELINMEANVQCPQSCGPNSQCVEGKCVCDKGFQATSNSLQCLPDDESPVMNLQCLSDFTKCSGMCCAPNSQCVEGQCVCGPDFRVVVDEEELIVDCEFIHLHTNAQCSQSCGPNSQCVEGKCVCDKGFQATSHSLQCLADEDIAITPKVQEFPFVCKLGFTQCSQKCCGSNTECIDGQCTCKTGFKEHPSASADYVECEKIATPKEIVKVSKCNNEAELCSGLCCGPHSFCFAEKCVCYGGFIEKLDKLTNKTICEAVPLEEIHEVPEVIDAAVGNTIGESLPLAEIHKVPEVIDEIKYSTSDRVLSFLHLSLIRLEGNASSFIFMSQIIEYTNGRNRKI